MKKFMKILQKYSLEISKTVNSTSLEAVKLGGLESISDNHDNIITSETIKIGSQVVRVELFRILILIATI